MKIKDLVLISVFTALIAVGAFIRIPVPVCPITLQFLFTTLAGVLLGGKNGFISVAVYVLLGLCGIPIFASGGGIGYVFNPTFGYLIGFCLGTFVTGQLVGYQATCSIKRLLIANFVGLAIVYGLGIVYYWIIMTYYIGSGITMWTLFLYCFLLTIPGDILSCILASFLGKRLLPVIRKSEV